VEEPVPVEMFELTWLFTRGLPEVEFVPVLLGPDVAAEPPDEPPLEAPPAELPEEAPLAPAPAPPLPPPPCANAKAEPRASTDASAAAAIFMLFPSGWLAKKQQRAFVNRSGTHPTLFTFSSARTDQR